MRKTIILTSLFLIFVAFVSTSSAIDVPIFGPVQYSRKAGKPKIYHETFYGLTGEARVIVHNGDENGDHRVSSALIFLNGQQLFGPHDFNQQVSILEATVNSDAENIISVELRSKPGSHLTIQINQIIKPGVTVSWVGPSGGTVSDPGGASVFIPPGALAEERLLSIKTHHNMASLPAPAPFIGGVNLGPDGLEFQLPITITLPLNTNLLPGTQLPLFLYDSQESGWSYTGLFAYVNPDEVTASADVTHFSDYIVMGMEEGDVNWPMVHVGP